MPGASPAPSGRGVRSFEIIIAVTTRGDILNSMNTDAQLPVTVYTSPTCGFCHMAMDYLTEKGVHFTEKDISTDQEALQFVLEKIGQAVTPIITIGDQNVVGFDRPKID